jgi:transcription factor SPT20
MAGYNRTRYVEELLEQTDALPPSFSVHLHPEYWTLNNGSKFLYNNQIAVRVSRGNNSGFELIFV